MQKLILANGKMFHGGAKLSAFAGRRHNLTVMDASAPQRSSYEINIKFFCVGVN